MAIKERSPQPEKDFIPRWKRLLALSPMDTLKCLYNGESYRVGDLKPIHKNEYSDDVDEFESKSTGDRVDVRLLRAYRDGIRCSLMERKNY